MILFFNLHAVQKEAGTSLKKFVGLLRYLMQGLAGLRGISMTTIPDRKTLVGHSFILNPAPILISNQYDISFVVQYIQLAARRDYTHYKFYNSKTLDTTFFPELDLEKVKKNPLLSLVGKQIYFKYEEEYGTSIR